MANEPANICTLVATVSILSSGITQSANWKIEPAANLFGYSDSGRRFQAISVMVSDIENNTMYGKLKVQYVSLFLHCSLQSQRRTYTASFCDSKLSI